MSIGTPVNRRERLHLKSSVDAALDALKRIRISKGYDLAELVGAWIGPRPRRHSDRRVSMGSGVAVAGRVRRPNYATTVNGGRLRRSLKVSMRPWISAPSAITIRGAAMSPCTVPVSRMSTFPPALIEPFTEP
jgi:hypothetical protein